MNAEQLGADRAANRVEIDGDDALRPVADRDRALDRRRRFRPVRGAAPVPPAPPGPLPPMPDVPVLLPPPDEQAPIEATNANDNMKKGFDRVTGAS